MDSLDCLVIGAGVVGLSAASALARAGREVFVVEAETGVGTQTSSRNSEVIHAGLYYPPGSAKARLCVRGRELLYAYCKQRGIRHKACGKLIVATTEAEMTYLRELARNAAANGVTDLSLLPANAVHALEPSLEAAGGLWSPSSGIVDSHALMLSLHANLEAAGGQLALDSAVAVGGVKDGRPWVRLGGDVPYAVSANLIINAAGLRASHVAALFHEKGGWSVPATRYARGVYFRCSPSPPFSHLVYPVPEPGGLGIHATIDITGAVRFGPDVEWIDKIDYSIDPGREAAFRRSIARYWPAVKDAELVPDYAGIRPKLSGPGAPAADFLIAGPERHGVPGLVHLLGIESPGLTAALAIGEELVQRADAWTASAAA